MTKVLVRVHPLYLMNVVQTECLVPNCLALSTKRATNMSIHHHICYYYSAHKPILSLPSHRGGRPRRQLPGSSTPQALLKGIMVRLTCYYTIHLHAPIP